MKKLIVVLALFIGVFAFAQKDTLALSSKVLKSYKYCIDHRNDKPAIEKTIALANELKPLKQRTYKIDMVLGDMYYMLATSFTTEEKSTTTMGKAQEHYFISEEKQLSYFKHSITSYEASIAASKDANFNRSTKNKLLKITKEFEAKAN